MASEIRVDKINSLSGVGTVTLSPTGVDIAGITTAATLRATTGIVTSLTAGSLTSLGAVSGTTGTFSAAVSGTTGTFSGAVSGTTGTFTGDVDIADTIVHTGDTNTKIRFPSNDNISFEVGGTERLRIDDADGVIAKHATAANLRVQNSTAATSQVAQLDLAPANGVSGVQLKATSEEDFSTGANRTAFFSAHVRKDGTFYERLRITSGGSLLIGHTSSEHSDGYQLELSATNSNGSIALTSIQDNIYASQLSFVKARGSSLGSKTIVQDGDILGQFAFYGTDGTNRALGATINVRVDGTPGNDDMPTRIDFATSPDGSQTVTNRLRLRSSGDVQIPNGNLVFQTSGKGIDFSATSDVGTSTSELFDDYEEGTYTPTDSSGAGLSLTNNNTARYTKIGRMVYVQFDITYPSTSNSASAGFSLPTSLQVSYGSGVIGWTDRGYPLFIHVGGYAYVMDNNSSIGSSSQHSINSELSGKRLIGNFWYIG